LIGAKIRDRRSALGVTQASLAARVGISASYLNLIESSKRNIGGSLMKRIAGELGLAIDDLDGASERRLLDDLAELTAEPLLANLHLDRAASGALAAQHGAWSRALIRLHRAWLDSNRAVGALSDRLNQDPFLGDAVHSMLTNVAAIRSSSEILETVPDLAPEEHARFVSIIAAETSRLSDVAQALAAFFDKAHTDTRSITPVEEVDDFLAERNDYFPLLEEVAEAFRRAAGIEGDCRESAIVDYLRRAHGITVVERTSDRAADAREPVAFDAGTGTVEIADSATRATRRFELARLAGERFDLDRAIDGAVAASSLLSSDAARRRARRALSSYLAAAVLMPYEAFHSAAASSRYDIDRLMRRFDASFEQVCHRLLTLKRPGAEGVPFALMRVDAAGHVTKRFTLPDLLLPRHGNACPLWAVYHAMQTPGAIVRQLVEFPGGNRFLFMARAVEKPRPAFALPRRLMSIMLACDALHADRMVYGDGLDLSSSAPAIPVGANCRLCVRRACAYREEDPIIDA
jgi:predicted transcriptional regulator/transcriptional regulator with XRE-family HTH domain